MAILFEVEDPRKIRVILSEEGWVKHILHNHPDMEKRLEQIKETIQKPFPCICQDIYEEDCVVYYSKPDKLYVRVVVKIMPKGYGLVESARRCSSPRKGEEIIWMHSSN